MSFRKAVLWSIGGQTASYFALFIGSVIVARLLTPHEMGVFAVALAAIGILTTFVAFNVGAFIVREKELQQSTIDTAFTVQAMLALVLGAAIALSSIFTRHVLHSPDVARVLLPLALTPVIGILEFRPSTMLEREMNFRLLSIIQTSRGLITTGCVVILAYAHQSYMSLAYGNLIGAVVSAIWTNMAAPKHISFRMSLKGARQITLFGFRMMSIRGLANLSARLSDIILGQFLGLSALGLYSRASSISSLVFENVYGAITRVVFVRMSEDFRTTGRVRDTFIRSYQMILALLWPIQIGLAILSGPFIYHLYGPRWVAASLPLSLLMIAQTIVLSFGMNWELFVLKDETARQTRFEFVKSVAGLAFFSIGCFFNIAAAATGRIAEAIFGFALYRPHMNRLAEVEAGCFARIFAQSTALTIAATGPALALMVFVDWSYNIPVALLVMAIGSGMLLWLLILAALKHPLLAELQSVAGKLLPRAI